MNSLQNFTLFDHIFIDNHASKTVFAFHGTGGSKEEWLFLNTKLKTSYNIVALDGNHNEDGLRRFFKRLAEGIFDEDNLRLEAQKLADFIQTWAEVHQQKIEDMWFLGYSNGANMILAELFFHPNSIKNCIALHASWPVEINTARLDLQAHTVFLTHGKNDHLVSQSQHQKLITLLQSTQAQITNEEYESGHQLSSPEMNDVIRLLLDQSST